MPNLRLAFRTLFRSPFVTGVAVVSLALGIGANAAIFSLFDQMLLQPLPVHQPQRLVNLGAPGPKMGSNSCNQSGSCEQVFSYPMFRDLERAETPFSGLAAHRLFDANIAIAGHTLNGQGAMVSGSYFPVLGIRPALGRLLGYDDDAAIGAHSVAVVGYDFWQNRLGGDPDVVGRTIVVNGQPFDVIGIAPQGFRGTTVGGRPVLYVPLSMRGVLQPAFSGFENRREYWAYVFGRLKPGATIEQAAAAINAVYRPIIRDVETALNTGMTEQTQARFLEKQVTLEDGRRGQSSVHSKGRVPLTMLLATAGIVLLIACANIANLLLARGAQRGLEIAVRLSLGAPRRHVLTQLLTESVVLAVLGGIASLLVAHWTLAGIGGVMPAEVSESLRLELNGRVVIFAGALSVLTGLLFGIFPSLHSTRSNLVTTIRTNAENLTGSRAAGRFRTALVTAQIALSMALLMTAGLFIRSLSNISRIDLGFSTENVITFAVSPELNGYHQERARQLFERIEEELGAIPGVTHVSAGYVPVLAGSTWNNDVSVEGFERGPDTDVTSSMNRVGHGYFATLQLPLRAGREFTAFDNATGARVAVVNEAFARKFNMGQGVVGRRMGIGGDALDIEIVGLVADARYADVKDETPAVYYIPWRQASRVGAMTFYVRSSIEPAQILRAVPGLVARIDPNLPVEQLKTLPQQVRENVFIDRMIGILSASFAGLATLLAAVGLYGVLAYTVTLRTREFGVRMALGADRAAVRSLVLRQVAGVVLLGGTIGIAAAIAIGRLAGSILFGVSATEPIVIASAVAVLGLFAFAAGLLPAMRASGLDPVKALRWQ
jgi:predicted permease